MLLGSYVGIVVYVHVFSMLFVAFAVIFSPSEDIFLDFWLRRAVLDVFGTRSGLERKKIQKKIKIYGNMGSKGDPILSPWRPLLRSGAVLGGPGAAKAALRASKSPSRGVLKSVILVRVFTFFELWASPRSSKCRLGGLGAPTFASRVATLVDFSAFCSSLFF